MRSGGALDEARRIAANVAKLPELRGRQMAAFYSCAQST
jgi:hypothetical protein